MAEDLLIYTPEITIRLRYVAQQFFSRILGLKFTLTTDRSAFLAYSGPKLAYAKQSLGVGLWMKSHDLLFDGGIEDYPIGVVEWSGIPCFFQTAEHEPIACDLLAASFYLLTRYEEYLPHVSDEHGRFPAAQSLGARHGFLTLPVVDLWAQRLLGLLTEQFGDLKAQKNVYHYCSMLNVSASHEFLYRGFLRQISGVLMDILGFKLRRLGYRALVGMGMKRDPYDLYEEVLKAHKKLGQVPKVFFQLAQYGPFDKNVSPYNRHFQHLIKSVGDYAQIALAASYASFDDPELLLEEKKVLSDIVHRPIDSCKTRYNRLNIPLTYRDMVDAGFTQDYSMGYTHDLGFRAGTCTPFYFYDLYLEMQQPIMVYPFAVQDYALLKEKSVADALRKMQAMYDQVHQLGGWMGVIFSMELLGSPQKYDWKKLYVAQLKAFYAAP
ncbi:MAG: polysaccharide deacetylase family protein [Flavobacteriaceae bacterium]|jgi:hypothetical protein|nr:polysaccharide deacetylase family protein [Flavobacteriaceae bacterium]MDP4674884.1 polysaccharide deacetylase family protein [Flavobacteriaceae bacterium]MDP4755442.1 polysaccharide deacetylase family protein [Flavobacteriaceae bacterium]MDP4794045.1 polysaccharide deacetylase family protein [Flavobacteriaceae bacterium]